MQHDRFSCPSLSPGVCSNSCPLSRWCHPIISSSAASFFSCLQSFVASESFPMSLLFISLGQSIVTSASASILPMNIQDWFPLGMTGWIFLQSKGFSRVFSSTIVWKHLFSSAQFNSVQSLSRVQLFITPWIAARQASLSITITNSQSYSNAMSIESVMPSNHLILCCPLLLLHSIFPSIRVFSFLFFS